MQTKFNIYFLFDEKSHPNFSVTSFVEPSAVRNLVCPPMLKALSACRSNLGVTGISSLPGCRSSDQPLDDGIQISLIFRADTVTTNFSVTDRFEVELVNQFVDS